MVPGLELLAALVGALLVVHILIHRRLPDSPKSGLGWGCILLATVILIFLASIALGPIGGQRHPEESMMMQACRTLALAGFQYANDNGGAYPTGASSTEVFQKLMDGNYISDPALFYVPMESKTAAVLGARLKPENVCYDVTADVNGDSPDGLPVVFVTGFRIEYRPGGRAVSLVKPFPSYYRHNDGWWATLQTFEGLPVAYKTNSAWFKVSRLPGQASPQVESDGFGFVPNVLSLDFEPAGRVYRQLTPNGILR